MDNEEFITIKIGDICFDVPIKFIENAKPFNIECVTDKDKIKHGI